MYFFQDICEWQIKKLKNICFFCPDQKVTEEITIARKVSIDTQKGKKKTEIW